MISQLWHEVQRITGFDEDETFEIRNEDHKYRFHNGRLEYRDFTHGEWFESDYTIDDFARCYVPKPWFPKNGEIAYFIDPADMLGYDDTQITVKHKRLAQRGIKLYRTLAEVVEAVKKLGWEVGN